MLPENISDFRDLTHGADYYSRGGHIEDFDFLFKGERTTCVSAMGKGGSKNMSPREGLAFLVGRLRALNMQAIAVDLTTEELRDAGLWVVRVVIPELLPISFVHRARFLGTRRLYEYSNKSGRTNFTEEEVNPAPLPFA